MMGVIKNIRTERVNNIYVINIPLYNLTGFDIDTVLRINTGVFLIFKALLFVLVPLYSYSHNNYK